MGWISRWAGSYTFISCDYWGGQYYHSLEQHLGVHFDHTLFIHRRGTVAFYVRRDEFERLGKFLAEIAVKDRAKTKKWLEVLKHNTDVIVPIMERLQNKIPSWQEYQEFLPAFERHLAYHVFMKKTVDFLPVDKLDQLLPMFKDARVYSERVYSDTESFFRSVAKKIAAKENSNADYLTCLTKKELEDYLQKGVLPDKTILKQRFEKSVLYFEKDSKTIIVGDQVDELEQLMASERLKQTDVIKGMTGYPGKAKGVVRVVLDPFKPGEFNKGDILVTGMTRPEFMPLIKKAGAIVTDVGGILCHAAITARELKKPCVIGTEIATKALKSGKGISVDAELGIIKKL